MLGKRTEAQQIEERQLLAMITESWQRYRIDSKDRQDYLEALVEREFKGHLRNALLYLAEDGHITIPEGFLSDLKHVIQYEQWKQAEIAALLSAKPTVR